MPAAHTEHRGWEIATDYHQHYLDDVNWDLAEDQSETGIGWFLALLVFATVIAVGLWLLGKDLEPPPIYFPPPQVAIISPQVPLGWKAVTVLPPTTGLGYEVQTCTIGTSSVGTTIQSNRFQP